jgi:two-component system heavy metal sensor histidine kinase CusS
LIDSLLFLARAEDPSAQLAIESLNVRNEVQRIVDFFGISAAEKGERLEVDILPHLVIRADKSLFQRAIGNLITNSIRYTPPGGEIVISAEETPDAVVIQVKDTGEGIAADHLPKVFDRFYRVDPSRSAASGGAGLGLSIVKGIMTLHRGHVEILSQVGSGTKVRLSFPSHVA